MIEKIVVEIVQSILSISSKYPKFSDMFFNKSAGLSFKYLRFYKNILVSTSSAKKMCPGPGICHLYVKHGK
jgi:hypothetical protein